MPLLVVAAVAGSPSSTDDTCTRLALSSLVGFFSCSGGSGEGERGGRGRQGQERRGVRGRIRGQGLLDQIGTLTFAHSVRIYNHALFRLFPELVSF